MSRPKVSHKEKLRVASKMDSILQERKQKDKEKRNRFFTLTDYASPGEIIDNRYLQRLKDVCKKTKFFDKSRDKYRQALAEVAKRNKKWIRKPEDWTFRTHNPDRQFGSLIRHLFAEYDVPLFLDEVWFKSAVGKPAWWVDVAQGKNIRKVSNFPLPIFTKKMAHIMMHSPKDFSVSKAIRWAQIHGLGGDGRTYRAVSEIGQLRALGGNHTREAFYTTIIQWFINHPMLDTEQYHPIFDYIYNEKFVIPAPYIRPDGEIVRPISAANPNFEMKGRSPESILRHTEVWHKESAKEKKSPFMEWHPSNEVIGAQYNTKVNGKIVTWEFTQLLNSKELSEEGKAMSHCVGSYARSCARGEAIIFSLTKDGRRAVTIEVSRNYGGVGKQVSQVRGRCNRRPKGDEMSRIIKWSQDNGVPISKWLQRG